MKKVKITFLIFLIVTFSLFFSELLSFWESDRESDLAQATPSQQAGNSGTQKPAQLNRIGDVISNNVQGSPIGQLPKQIADKDLASLIQSLEASMPNRQVQAKLWAAKKNSYEALLRSWNIDERTIAEVLRLIEERDLFVSEAKTKSLLAGVGSAESKKLSAKANSFLVDANDKLAKVLGNERANQLRFWEDSRREREHLGTFVKDLGVPINDEDEQAILNAMYTARLTLNKGRSARLERMGPNYPKEVERLLPSTVPSNVKDRLVEYLSGIARSK